MTWKGKRNEALSPWRLILGVTYVNFMTGDEKQCSLEMPCPLNDIITNRGMFIVPEGTRHCFCHSPCHLRTQEADIREGRDVLDLKICMSMIDAILKSKF